MALPDYETDYVLDTGGYINTLATIRNRLPEVITSGATIVVNGVPKFKTPPNPDGEFVSGQVARRQAIDMVDEGAEQKLRRVLDERLKELKDSSRPLGMRTAAQKLAEVASLLSGLSKYDADLPISVSIDVPPSSSSVTS